MFEIINKNTINEFEQFISTHPKGHFLQSHKWAAVKDSWKWEAIAVRSKEGKIVAAMSLLIRPLPAVGYTMMYAARGPVCDLDDKWALEELTRGVQALAKKHKAYVFKMDPDVKSDETGFISILEELGYTRHAASKNFEGIQPNYVFRLDVKDKTEEELLAAFVSKTRYNLRLSYRKGVEVRQCGKEMLPDFTRIMVETGTRDGFVTRPQSYFETMMDSLGEDARLYMAFLEDKPVAGTLAIHFGNKVWYLYGASSNQHRNAMPNYQLQWEMIRWALETKAEIYDFRGVSGDLTPENPLYGLYLFKKGFSGEFTEFCGEFEMVFNKTVYLAATKGIPLVRNLRRKLVVGVRRLTGKK